MNKTLIIIQREYLTRIRKKSFIVMTLLGPVLFAAMIILPVLFATMDDEDIRHIAVIDDNQPPLRKISETENFKFTYEFNEKKYDFRLDLENLKKNLSKTEFFGILYLKQDYYTNLPVVVFYSYKQPSVKLTQHIKNAIEKQIRNELMKGQGIDVEKIESISRQLNTGIDVRTFKLSEKGDEKESHSLLNMAVAYISAFMIYMFIFLFGSQVMRGVIEEKTGRIVEVIISSVKPFQLLMGKVVGVALVGLTQFLAWVILTLLLVVPAKALFLSNINGEIMQQQTNRVQITANMTDGYMQHPEASEKAVEILNIMQSINFGVLIACFLFFFIGGYLLYGSLFAAIGSAADSETDTQQFMLPVSIPLIIAIMVMINAMQNPNGPLAFWFSIIPLTSPVVMMARIPFGVPYIELALSIILLILAFVGTIWLSAKIYRTGILVYGKKLTWGELWKWLKYKN